MQDEAPDPLDVRRRAYHGLAPSGEPTSLFEMCQVGNSYYDIK